MSQTQINFPSQWLLCRCLCQSIFPPLPGNLVPKWHLVKIPIYLVIFCYQESLIPVSVQTIFELECETPFGARLPVTLAQGGSVRGASSLASRSRRYALPNPPSSLWSPHTSLPQSAGHLEAWLPTLGDQEAGKGGRIPACWNGTPCTLSPPGIVQPAGEW